MRLENFKNIEDQPELIVMVGLPGTGKSTYIKKNFPGHTVISSDDIIERHASEEGKTYDEVFQKYIGMATGKMKENFREAVQNMEDIVWDQTNLSKKKRRGILQQTPDSYRKIAIVFDIPDKVRYDRLGQREGKNIPDHVNKSMEQSFQYPTVDEGFDRIIKVED